MRIKLVQAYEVIASGGYPSIEVVVTLQNNLQTKASISYGASDGSKEARIILDAHESRYSGHGMNTVVNTIENIISPELEEKSVLDQREIDRILRNLDGTPMLEKLGANAILPVSMAIARAGALCQDLPLYKYLHQSYGMAGHEYLLPNPLMVMIEGGAHAKGSTDFQEYLVAVRSKTTASESIRTGLEIYHATKEILIERGYSTNVGSEGAFAPGGIASNVQPLEILVEAISRAGYSEGEDALLALDIAASELYHSGQYELKTEQRMVSSTEFIDYCVDLKSSYPLYSIEDPLDENDWAGWVEFKQKADEAAIKTIGDDLTVTNPQYIQEAVNTNAISGVVIKPNQIGTVTDTMDACKMAQEYSLDIITSHRGGGETNDTFITDLSVAVNAHFIKCGPTRGERVEKYNRLMEIERELGSKGHVRGDTE